MITNHDFSHGGLTLRATIHTPGHAAPSPTVVLVHRFANNRMETGVEVGSGYLKGRDIGALDHYAGNATLEVIEGADHGYGSVPHRTRLHQSTLTFLRQHLERG